jgi:hypothetical protein
VLDSEAHFGRGMELTRQRNGSGISEGFCYRLSPARRGAVLALSIIILLR